MTSPSLGISIALAFLLHAITIALLNSLKLPEPPNEAQSIPIQLTSTRSIASVSASNQSAATTSKKDVINTKGASLYKQHDSITEKTAESNTKQTQASSVSSRYSQQSRQSKSSQAGASVKSLFQTEMPTSSDIAIIQKKENTTELSAYEQLLLKHLLGEKLYDDFHPVMELSYLDSVSYNIQLTLFGNGAIKSAYLTKNSASSQIDKLALTAAFNASPYPKPPAGELSNGFTYNIPVKYYKKQFD
jgi:outer membrane biosynthesis protein TonB